MHQFKKVDFEKLTDKNKGKKIEVYNFHKAAAKLADYGFDCIRVVNDWGGVDFLAYHSIEAITLRVQLKSRLTIRQDYLDKGLWIVFPVRDDWYLIEHDLLVCIAGECTPCLKNNAWNGEQRECNWKTPPNKLIKALGKYRL